MKIIWTLAIKDFRLLLRDRAAFFFTFFFPVLYAIFFGAIFSGSGGEGSNAISVLLVDEDRSAGSRQFVALLAQAEELKVIPSDDKHQARETVRRGNRVAYIALPEGFGEARQNIFGGETPRLEIGVDPARKAESGMLQGILTKYAAQAMQQAFQDPQVMRNQLAKARQSVRNAPPALQVALGGLYDELESFFDLQTSQESADSGGFGGFQPLEIDSVAVTAELRGPQNSFAISFPQGIIWGMLSCVSGFAISLVLERQKGTLLRLRTAPLSRIQILAGKALGCLMAILAVSGGLLLLARLVFGVRPQSPGLLALALLSAALAFVGIMMLLSVLGKTERAAGGISWAIMIVMAMLGGGMLPLFLMPSWMQTVSHISPVKWAVLALEGALWRQFSFSEMLLPCGILLAIGAVCFAAGVRAFRWNEA